MSKQVESIEPIAACSLPFAARPTPAGEALPTRAAAGESASGRTIAGQPASTAAGAGAAPAALPPACANGAQSVQVAAEYTLVLETGGPSQPGWWRFRVRAADGTEQFEAGDVEPDARGERLSLLTAVRALEALEGPSHVTLVGASRYVRQGITFGLPEWRENGWQWEYFGQMVPVRDRDLWQRLDRALRFHQVDCRVWRSDGPHASPPAWRAQAARQGMAPRQRSRVAVAWERLRRWFETACGACGVLRTARNGPAPRRLAGAPG